jgi:predicted nucleotidyltransferase
MNKSQIVEVITEIDAIARKLSVSFFLVGATARDILFENTVTSMPRSTRDIDLAFSVDTWEKFEAVRKSMLASRKFIQDKDMVHRFIHADTNLLIDIIPFGLIESPPGYISWPYPEGVVLSTLGFRDAFDHSVTVLLSSDPDLEVKVGNLAGLVLMKFIAWKDKYPLEKKHAEDLLFIMRKYLDAGNIDRLHNEHQDISLASDFEWESASSRLLGRDIAAMAGPDALRKIIDILDEETAIDSPNHLVRDMMKHRFSEDTDFEIIFKLVNQLKLGVTDRRKNEKI